MKTLFKWFLMLNKRLYKKLSFVAILLLIPISVFSFSLFADEDSGFVTIAIAEEDAADPISNDIVKDLVDNKGLLNLKTVGTPAEAEAAVKSGKADVAWIFPADMAGKIHAYLEADKPIVRVIEREPNVITMISREKLAAKIYKRCSKAYYLKYVRTHIPELENMKDSEVLAYYDTFNPSDDLFVFGSPNGEFSQTGSSGYLLSPIRGFLSVTVVLCGLAAALFYLQDDKKGTFAQVPLAKKPAVKLGCILIAVLNMAVVMFVSLLFSGLFAVWYREVLGLLLFVLCTAAFSYFFLEVISSVKIIGALLPLLVIAMIALCPIFFDFRSVQYLQLILPPTYYINAMYNDKYLLYMLGYAILLTLLGYLFSRFIRRGNN